MSREIKIGLYKSHFTLIPTLNYQRLSPAFYIVGFYFFNFKCEILVDDTFKKTEQINNNERYKI